MKSVVYKKTSPYSETKTYGNFLDVMTYKSIPKLASDVLYQIDAIYQFRPDLLANDLYNDPDLWWVFSVRNPNTLQDPIFDFAAGAIIHIPKIENIKNALGI